MITEDQLETFKKAKQQKIPHYTHFYGMVALFKDLLEFPSWVLLDVHLDHGIIIRLDKPDQYLAGTKANLILVDNNIRKNMVPEKKNVFVLGPLFMRYRRKYGFKYNASAKGTIVFPTHSSHHLSLEMEWKKYAEQLVALPAEFQPVTVCLYWIDVLKGENKYFEEAGIDVISNGPMFDDKYAFYFYSNLSKFKYASGNEPGSFLFYAIEMGMPFFMFGPDAKIVNDGHDATAAKEFEFKDIDYARTLKEAFNVNIQELKSFEITQKQRDLVNLVANEEEWIDLSALRTLVLKNIAKTSYKRLKKSAKKTLYRFVGTEYLKKRMKKLIHNAIKRYRQNAALYNKKKMLDNFYQSGQKPWAPGYEIHKKQEIIKALYDEVVKSFAANTIPTPKYGYKLDERIVEYPWIFSRLSTTPGLNVLDAGSTFNFEHIISHDKVTGKNLYIQTFYPEKLCFWKKRISYVFGDLRDLPYRDGLFDEIICQSTLEHIDMDNSLYGYSNDGDKRLIEKSYDFLKVIHELVRVLRPGGRLLLTFPFGKFENHGFFQQFDGEMLEKLLQVLTSHSKRTELTFFKYMPDGWMFSKQEDCADCMSYNPHTKKGNLGDGAAHSRSVCCVAFDKF